MVENCVQKRDKGLKIASFCDFLYLLRSAYINLAADSLAQINLVGQIDPLSGRRVVVIPVPNASIV